MASMREQYPEAMALADLCNATADGARAIWFAFLAFLTFLAMAVFGTTHRDLFLATPLALPPPISIGIDLVGFYVVAPLILAALHVYMLLKLTLLARVHGDFEAQLTLEVPFAGKRAQARKHLNTTLFLRALSDWRVGQDARTPILWIMTGLLVGSLVLAPVATLLFTWIRFLPYQDEAVTMLHRIVFAADVAAILVAFRAVAGRPGRVWGRRAAWGATGLFIAAAWIVLTFPRECWADTGDAEGFCWDNNALLQWAGMSRTVGYKVFMVNDDRIVFEGVETTAPAWPPTTLQLANEDFVDDVKIPDLSKLRFTYNLRSRSLVGADLDNTDLRKVALVGADLRAASLSRAELDYADLSEAQLQGAVLSLAQMHGANLSNAEMQGADLRFAQMHSADLQFAQMQGADLRYASMQSTKLLFAKTQGAVLFRAQMHGAILSNAEMQGADLRYASMQGADLRYAGMQGADLSSAQMQGAFLLDVAMQGVDLSFARMQGARVEKTSLWRTKPKGILADGLLVIEPKFVPVRRKLVDEWLESIPAGRLRDRAAHRLRVLTSPDFPAIYGPARRWWEARAIMWFERSRPAENDKRFEEFRKSILAYACSGEEGVEAAIEGILRGVLSGDAEHVKSIRAEIEACRSGN